MGWTTPKELRQQVQKLWDKGSLLASMLDNEPIFPKRLVLKTPTSRELAECYTEVRQWIASLQQASGFRIKMKTVRHRLLGENSLPSETWLDSFDHAIKIIGKQKQVDQFTGLIAMTQSRATALIPWLKAHPLKALSLADDWSKLLAIIDWLKAHPEPAVYLRQVDIPGIDTKFIESHRSILIILLDLALPVENINTHATGIRQFDARYGFLQKPLRIRFRALDKDIRLLTEATQDLSLNHEAFRLLDQDKHFRVRIRKVFITENEINFLSFPTLQHGLVIFGAGYGFEALSDIPWISRLEVYYWGDIDTHGFAILDQLRAKLPHAKNLLMDEPTLLAHKPFWDKENKPEHRKLDRLTTAELQLYNRLCNNHFADNLRLEQERISFNFLLTRLDKIK